MFIDLTKTTEGLRPVVFASFSGGMTSGYMCSWLQENLSDLYDIRYLFANTGQEHEKTLEFVNQCDQAFGLNLVWLEAVAHAQRGKSSTHRVVSYETASRGGEPFEDVIRVYGIPNASFPHCNRELKINAMESYIKSLGFKRKHPRFIGIRADEIDRMTSDPKCLYPLISLNPTTKADVVAWWSKQSFGLGIPEHLGNCVTCWKKSDRKLMTLAKHEPERFEFFDRMEKEYPDAGAGEGGRVFFRKHRNAQDIITAAREPFDEFTDTKNPGWVRFSDPVPDVDPLDIEDSCGASCEAM